MKKTLTELAFARGNLSSNRDFKLSQNYVMTVFSRLFSQVFVKRDLFMLTSNSCADHARYWLYNGGPLDAKCSKKMCLRVTHLHSEKSELLLGGGHDVSEFEVH